MFHNVSFRSLLDVLGQMDWQDLADISVVSVLLYFALQGLTSRRATRLVRGVLLLGALYLVARQTGMTLTVTLFQSFFTVFLVALVILFQEDLRLFFERLTVWRWNDPSDPRQEELIQAVVRAATVFARDRIGALIIIKGRDPIERHLRGGQALGGEVSSALLESIFDPHSAGHDGAAIIENNRITRFGVHLPLSHNREGIESRGTRHAAALGLAELVDAFCVVISEENGMLSAAYNGTIVEMPSRKSLESALQVFLGKISRSPEHNRVWHTMTHRLGTKLLSLGIGLTLWLVFVQGFKPVDKEFVVRVNASDVPDKLRIASITPSEVTVRVSGLSRDLARVRRPGLFINLSVAKAGMTRVILSEDDIRLNGPARLMSIEPPLVDVELVKTKPAAVPAPVRREAAPSPAKKKKWNIWR